MLLALANVIYKIMVDFLKEAVLNCIKQNTKYIKILGYVEVLSENSINKVS